MNAVITAPAKPDAFAAILNPATAKEMTEAVTILANSGMVPQAFAGKPNAIIVAGAMGARVGLDLMGSLLGICVINGRPSLWGDVILGLVRRSEQLESHTETWSGAYASSRDKISDDFTATCTVKRKGDPEPHIGTFSVADAKIAQLWGKAGPWQTNPKRMLMMRARSFALRDTFADVLQGFEVREVLEDRDFEVVDSQPLPEAKMRAIPLDPGNTDEVRASKKRQEENFKLIEAEQAKKAAEAAKATLDAVAKEREAERLTKKTERDVRDAAEMVRQDQEKRGAETEAITANAQVIERPATPDANPATPDPVVVVEDPKDPKDPTTAAEAIAWCKSLAATYPNSLPYKSVLRACKNTGIAKVGECPQDKIAALMGNLKAEERYLNETPPELIAEQWANAAAMNPAT